MGLSPEILASGTARLRSHLLLPGVIFRETLAKRFFLCYDGFQKQPNRGGSENRQALPRPNLRL